MPPEARALPRRPFSRYRHPAGGSEQAGGHRAADETGRSDYQNPHSRRCHSDQPEHRRVLFPTEGARAFQRLVHCAAEIGESGQVTANTSTCCLSNGLSPCNVPFGSDLMNRITSQSEAVFRHPGGARPINRLKALIPLVYLTSGRGADRRRWGPRRARIRTPDQTDRLKSCRVPVRCQFTALELRPMPATSTQHQIPKTSEPL